MYNITFFSVSLLSTTTLASKNWHFCQNRTFYCEMSSSIHDGCFEPYHASMILWRVFNHEQNGPTKRAAQFTLQLLSFAWPSTLCVLNYTRCQSRAMLLWYSRLNSNKKIFKSYFSLVLRTMYLTYTITWILSIKYNVNYLKAVGVLINLIQSVGKELL